MKEQGWLRMEKINTDYKLEKFWLNFSRCASRDVARFRAFGHSLMVIRARFSFECRKVIGFCTFDATRFAPLSLFYPIRSTVEPNPILTRSHAFSRVLPQHSLLTMASATGNYFEFWLAYCIICVLCDWLDFGFGFTTLKWKPLWRCKHGMVIWYEIRSICKQIVRL